MSSIDTMVTPRERGVSTVATTLFTFRHAAPSRSAPQRVLRRNDAVHQPVLLAFVRGRGLQPLFRVNDRLAQNLVDIRTRVPDVQQRRRCGLTPQACNPIRWTRRRDDPPTPKTPSSSITQVAGSGMPPGMGRSQMG